MQSTIKRRHQMPFGAELLDNGHVHFRLWAPGAEQVDVCLADGGSQNILSMAAEKEGWFGIVTDQATAGSRYYFRINGEIMVPDPASRYQPQDVHEPSEVVDPHACEWHDAYWLGLPWEEAIIYELHVGTFTSEGNFSGVIKKLDYLKKLGVTAIELMPVADFPRARNWGYDGAYLFAPDSIYGRPDDLKALIDAAHAREMMVFLDVVYNHFGPDGNYLHVYAPQFFTERHQTPWGAGINFDGKHSLWVRQFFIHNALYWLEEYHFDGLRLDAVHAILDDSRPDILTELAQRVHQFFGHDRHIHLILENDCNAAHYLTRDNDLRPFLYTAQWNDDLHHVMHVLLTGESKGYYIDYADEPSRLLCRCLTDGFAYQGERSRYRDNQPRGEPSDQLPSTAFVSFLQNHDQVGNRAFGERISTLAEPERIHAAMVLLLLAPQPPLLFMGQEWNCRQPFPFFCDFGPDLADKVVAGRRQEFARFPEFSEPAAREKIPDPVDIQTFNIAVLDWSKIEQPEQMKWIDLHRELIALRHHELIPRLNQMPGRRKACSQIGECAIAAHWVLGDGSDLSLFANFGNATLKDINHPLDHILYATHDVLRPDSALRQLPPWCVVWTLQAAAATT